MSRIGKNPVAVPDKVEVKVQGNNVNVKGPKGELKMEVHDLLEVKLEGKSLTVNPKDKSNQGRALWGTARTLLSNMVVGVSDGFTKSLEFNGVGYKAAVTGNKITLNLGYSHPIDFELPNGVSAKVTKNVIDIMGSDKEVIGQVAAEIRSLRPPEPYKGKGLKYTNETIIRKAGKTGAKK